jgi:hypothetical protein
MILCQSLPRNQTLNAEMKFSWTSHEAIVALLIAWLSSVAYAFVKDGRAKRSSTSNENKA